MVAISNFEHAKIYVEDQAVARDFLIQDMGLTPVDEIGDTLYLGCGLDSNFDLAIEEGKPGLDHFAIRVTSDVLNDFEQSLGASDVSVTRIGGTEPIIEEGIRFDLPMGATMELVVVADERYLHSDEPRLDGRDGIAPIDIDHITFRCNPETLRTNTEFLEDEVGFSTTEVLIPEEGEDDEWSGSFTRYGVWHHDVGFVSLDADMQGFEMSHIAWTMSNTEHIKMLIDRLVSAGLRMEISPFRHYAGNNVAAYFSTPGGNFYEICAEMATVLDGAPTDYTSFGKGYSIWGGVKKRSDD